MWHPSEERLSLTTKIDVLIVEDSEDDFILTRELIKEGQLSSLLSMIEFRLEWARSLSAALDILDKKSFDLILLDLILHDVDGLDGLRKVHRAAPDAPIVVLTGLSDENLSVLALHNGAQDYLVKGQIDESTLTRSLRYSLERARVVRELEHARRRAEAASRFKSEFLANISHEIRSPLTPILGYAESLRDPRMSAEERDKAIETIVRASNHLLRVVSDVLDLSKIEAGRFELEMSRCSPFAILDEVEDLMKIRASEKKLDMDLSFAFPLPDTFVTDPTRLKQILINLVGNAIKFTERGAVRVKVSHLAHRKLLSFEVTDTGIGLTSKEQGRIFEPFSQAQSSIARCYGGTGLGLAISKQLAQRLGGDIVVTSAPGRGSTFTLTVAAGDVSSDSFVHERPSRGALPSRAYSLIPPRLEGRVLLAEDGPDNQRVISYLLRTAGLDVAVAEDGASAVELVREGGFDLVLMDMQMPVLDGYSATRELREQGIEVPIVALTAHAVRHKVARCFEAGCSDHLAKPFGREEFFLMLGKYLPSKGGGPEPVLPTLEETNGEYLSIVLDFIDRLPEAVERIEEAFDSRDWDVLQNLAHRLKGASLFGLPELSRLVERIEVAAEAKAEGEVTERLKELALLSERILAGRSQIESMMSSAELAPQPS